ncbi:MAG: ORF6N domain-containing protein [Arcobacteraceae bacterium]|nr:ORF6N domain-containing protein [Arcobacteraceae bacterium]
MTIKSRRDGVISDDTIFESKLIEIDNQLVLLAKDVAELYEVDVGHLNRIVNKYIHLFPEDYRFQLTKTQWENLKCIENISSLKQHGGVRHIPYAYTEKGLYMLATILTKSTKAKEIHFHIIETFAKIREVSRNISKAVVLTDKNKQNTLLTQSNKLLNEVIDADIIEEGVLEGAVQEIKDEFKLNLGFIQVSRTIVNKKK